MEFGSWKLEKCLAEIHIQGLDKLSWELSVGGFTGIIDSMLPVAVEAECREESTTEQPCRETRSLPRCGTELALK